jgi:hypothetical protein
MASINASTSGAGGVITTADATGILNLQTASTTAVTVDASQNVGIGTTSPSGKFHVANGDIYITNGYSLKYSATSYITPEDNSIGARISAGTITMWSGSTPAERMRIDSNGAVMVGTTSAVGIFTATTLNATQRSIHASSNGGSTTTDGVYYGFVNQVRGTGFNFMAFQNTSGVDFIVRGNGNVQNTNNSYGAISDVKLRENIVDATPKL